MTDSTASDLLAEARRVIDAVNQRDVEFLMGKLDPGYVRFFDQVDEKRGDALIAFGWAMADDLLKLA